MRILNRRTGVESETDLKIIEEVIVLRAVKSHPRTNWDKLFQKVIEEGHEPENDLFDGVSNDFDQTEW